MTNVLIYDWEDDLDDEKLTFFELFEWNSAKLQLLNIGKLEWSRINKIHIMLFQLMLNSFVTHIYLQKS